MATTRADFFELLNPQLKRVFFNEYQLWPVIYTMIFNTERVNRAYVDTIKVSGLGTVNLKPEGTPISYDEPVQGTRKRTIMLTFGLGFRVTMEMAQDDLYNIIMRMPRELATSVRQSKEALAWGVLNDAFSGSTYTGLDGLALCTTSHPRLKDGGTASNRPSPDLPLGVSGIEACLTNLRLTVNESGFPTPLTPEWLVIHPSLEHEAYRLLNSEKEPYTSDNQVSTEKSSRTGTKVLPSPYLSSTSAWFMVASKGQHSLTFYDRMSTRFESTRDAQTKSSLNDACYRANVTFDDWRGVVGQSPT